MTRTCIFITFIEIRISENWKYLILSASHQYLHLAYDRISHLDMFSISKPVLTTYAIFQCLKTLGFLVNYSWQKLSGHKDKRLCFVVVFCCFIFWKCSQISQKGFGYISQIICRGETAVDICQKGQIWINFTRLFALLHINFNMLKIISFLNGSPFIEAETYDKGMSLIKLFIITECVWPHIAISLK